MDPHRGEPADQQLHRSQRQPVQRLPQARGDHDADRPEGTALEPRLRLRPRHREPACLLDSARGASRRAGARRGSAAGRLGRSAQRHARRAGPRLAGNQLRPLPQSAGARAQFGPRPSGLTGQPHGLWHHEAAGGRGAWLGRIGVRHRAGQAGRIDPGISHRLDRRRYHDARARQAAGPRGRSGAGRAVDRGHARGRQGAAGGVRRQ